MTQAGTGARGWYLYGITRRASLEAALVEADACFAGDPIESAPLQVLDCSELSAVVRPVSLAEFSPAVLEERLRSASDVASIVRGHNRVIEAIHARQAILPARFGSVYATAEDIVSALWSACDTLLPRLQRLEGCDEWAVHLYADSAVVRDRVALTDPDISRLRAQHAAGPGRAYFINQQLSEALDAATGQALDALAQGALERLAGCAVDGQVRQAAAPAPEADEVEILRASFLVARDGTGHFKDEMRSCAGAGEGLRCEYTGPWPPYSFATPDEPVTG